MRRLTVISVAYPLATVGLDSVGGAEQILTALDHALTKAGHRSIVVAMQGSTVFGELAAYHAPGKAHTLDDAVISVQRDRVRDTLGRVLADTEVDLVHMHGIDFHHYLPPPGPPVLVTLHLPLAWYPADALAPSRPSTWVNCVSASQAASTPPDPRILPPISNGVPVGTLGILPRRKQGYALMLARICPEKGQHLALEAAHAAGTALLIGGEIFPYAAHQSYFDTRVRPLLDRRRRYLGPLNFRRKRRLLAGASCLLIPSLAAETSSLVAMEAASCGTPVIAFRNGALPEIVVHGRTGFLVDNADGMAAAMRRVGDIDPDCCRSIARERFTLERMAEAYISRYHAIAGSKATQAA